MNLPRISQKTYRIIGLMSGTSLDGVDVALVETDGLQHVKPIGFSYFPYDGALRDKLRACFGARSKTPHIERTEREVTLAHAHAVQAFMKAEGLSPDDIDYIGFHGQTITHDPDNRFTWQLGDGDLLARETGVNVVYDFRSADVAAGGQGAPLIPAYHRARAASSGVKVPTAILNIGGVSNVTWIGRSADDILAFDCGPGNALIDDLVLKSTGARYDADGKIARSGQVDHAILTKWLSHPFFAAKPPKSLDRGAWNVDDIANHSLPDAVATLTEFTVAAIVRGAEFFPEPAAEWYVAGGGRLNGAMMDGLRHHLKCPIHAVEAIGWNGDALEAEGFAYLAARSILGLPLSYPTTTSVPSPQVGGVVALKI